MLDEIGFYTLTDRRAMNASAISPMWRCELLLTSRCNFHCPYCRGFSNFGEDCDGDMPLDTALAVLDYWIQDGLKNVRFSGGEPTLYPYLNTLAGQCADAGVERLAVSTNGSANLSVYERLVESGVNDFSISLDACCASFGNKMAGVTGQWVKVIQNIEAISALTYVSLGCVFTAETAVTAKDVIMFAHGLGVADIRIISAAQWDGLAGIQGVPAHVLQQHPILQYRVGHFEQGRNVRGIQHTDCHQCYLVQDDSVAAGRWHFPCVIYLREGGNAIGEIGPQMRQERLAWMNQHDTYADPICRQNCLDVCIDYNNKCAEFVDKRESRDGYGCCEPARQTP